MSVDDLSEEQVAEFKDAFELFDKVDFEISQNLFFSSLITVELNKLECLSAEIFSALSNICD